MENNESGENLSICGKHTAKTGVETIAPGKLFLHYIDFSYLSK